MKLNKIILPLALALAATLATTGCKHQYNGQVTKLPNHQAPAMTGAGTSGSNDALPAATPIDTTQIPAVAGTGADTKRGGGDLPESWRPEDLNQDHDKLAAYTVHFKFDSAVVEDSEQANVASVGQALTSNPDAKLLIEGNCDERGTEEYNRALGERRALALREALARDGIDPMRIRTISYGKDKPVDPGHNEAAWAKNRRGDFVVCTPKS